MKRTTSIFIDGFPFGHWEEVEIEIPCKEFKSCVDKSKFIPENTDLHNYNGSASGSEPDYDFEDGKPTENYRFLADARRLGDDITEVANTIENAKANVKKSMDKANASLKALNDLQQATDNTTQAHTLTNADK